MSSTIITNKQALGIVRELADRAAMVDAKEREIVAAADKAMKKLAGDHAAEQQALMEKQEEARKEILDELTKEWEDYKAYHEVVIDEDRERLRLSIGLASWDGFIIDTRYIEHNLAFLCRVEEGDGDAGEGGIHGDGKQPVLN